MKKIEKVGDICPMCYTPIWEVEIHCYGKEERGEPMVKMLACRCLHLGDFNCNCGNPCSSFF